MYLILTILSECPVAEKVIWYFPLILGVGTTSRMNDWNQGTTETQVEPCIKIKKKSRLI